MKTFPSYASSHCLYNGSSTAPGKVILCGEHAVVYGTPAIAVPVQQVQASATIEPHSTPSVYIHAPDLAKQYPLANAEELDPLALATRKILSLIQPPAEPSFTLTVRSTIPLGRGLGSGAAISTALIKAVAQFYDYQLATDQLSTLVYEVEKLYHGTPSGIDNTVIAYQQPVYFVKGQPIERLKISESFTLVIADTGIISPTHKAVGFVHAQRQEAPDLYDSYFAQIAQITTDIRQLITRRPLDLVQLGQLFNANQALLVKIGVSSPELDQLVGAALQAGAYGAKLSGAGWGGNMIALVSPEQASKVAATLRNSGAVNTLITTVFLLSSPHLDIAQ